MFTLSCEVRPEEKAQVELELWAKGALSVTITGELMEAIFQEQVDMQLPVSSTWTRIQDHDWQYDDEAEVFGMKIRCPNTVFGNLQHPTTRLSCDLIESVLNEHPSPETLSMADIGCGSGVLSLATWHFGVRQILGFDIDPDAIACANDNAHQNNIHGISFETHDLHQWQPSTPYDLLIANVPGEHLGPFLSQIPNRLTASGKAVLSGISEANLELIQPKIDALPLSQTRHYKEGWYAWLLS